MPKLPDITVYIAALDEELFLAMSSKRSRSDECLGRGLVVAFATMDEELEALIGIARRAGARVMELYAVHQAGALPIEHKTPNDPVTLADREANTIICEALAQRFPEASVVAEESTPDRAELLRLVRAERVFYVDPVDGTREFVDKNDEFAVMIGLAVRGRAEAGVVLMPVDGTALAGRVGRGAFAEDARGARRPIAVSIRDELPQARMVVSRSHRPRIVDPLRRRLGIVGEPLTCGSAGLKMAMVARGEVEIFVHAGRGMQRWDTCGPEALLVAAGGRVTDLDGAAIDYGDPDLGLARGLVCSNGALHPLVLSATGWAERHA